MSSSVRTDTRRSSPPAALGVPRARTSCTAGLKPTDIDILIVNCSLFCPTPSLSAMIVNHFRMRPDVLSYNLGGMGCSAGVIAIGLAEKLLQVCGLPPDHGAEHEPTDQPAPLAALRYDEHALQALLERVIACTRCSTGRCGCTS